MITPQGTPKPPTLGAFVTAVTALSAPIVAAALLISTAYALPTTLSQLSPEDQQAVQLRMEAEAASRTGRLVACLVTPAQCVQGYETLLSLDWSQATLPPGATILIGERAGRTNAYQLSLPYNATPAALTKSHGARPLPTKGAQSKPLSLAQAIADITESAGGGRCTPDTAAAHRAIVSGPICEGRDEFYDSLFEHDEIELTMIRGYYDNPESADERGIPVFLSQDAEDFHRQAEDLHATYGFVLQSSTPTEMVLARSFWYKGHLKKARVRLVTSTVPCPGEKADQTAYRNASVCPAQASASRAALDAFRASLASGQITVYAGHSRYGKGPDFGPYYSTIGKFPIRDARQLEGIRFRNPRAVLYLNSCNSTSHFMGAVEKRRQELAKEAGGKELALITNSEAEYWKNYPKSVNRLFAALIQAQCPAEIGAMLDLSREFMPAPSEQASRAIVDGI